MLLPYILLALAAFGAGIINTIAGGGSFLVFPALLFAGLDPRTANITSTIALYPMQVSSGFAGRQMAGGTPHLSFNALILISLIGGVVGALLLLMTPAHHFAQLVPWLILFATVLFAWGSFRPVPVREDKIDHLGKTGAILAQFGISIYGGYFGGGIGLLMLAALTYAGMQLRQATTTKNILAAIMNTSAVAIFMLTSHVHWFKAGIVAVFAIAGGLIGVQMIHRVNERYLKMGVVVIGLLLTAAMFWKY